MEKLPENSLEMSQQICIKIKKQTSDTLKICMLLLLMMSMSLNFLSGYSCDVSFPEAKLHDY